MSLTKNKIYGYINGTVTESQLRSELNRLHPEDSANKNGVVITNNAIGYKEAKLSNNNQNDLLDQATIIQQQKVAAKLTAELEAAMVTPSIIDVHEVNGKLVTTSRNVAKVFGKRHADVLTDIGRAISTIKQLSNEQNEDLRSGLFIESVYQPDPNGRSYPEYLLTRDGLALLTFGYTGTKAMSFKLAYIERFNQMEQELYGRTTPTLQNLIQGVDWLPEVPNEQADAADHVTYPQLTSQVSTALSTRLPQEVVERIIGYITYASHMAYKKGYAVGINEAQRSLPNVQQPAVEFVDKGAYDELQALYNKTAAALNTLKSNTSQQIAALTEEKLQLENSLDATELAKEQALADKTVAQMELRNHKKLKDMIRHNLVLGYLSVQQASNCSKIHTAKEFDAVYKNVPLTELARTVLEDVGHVLGDANVKLMHKTAEARAAKTQLKIARDELSVAQHELKQQKQVHNAAMKTIKRLSNNACANADNVQQLSLATFDAQDVVSELLASLNRVQASLQDMAAEMGDVSSAKTDNDNKE